MKCIRPHSWSTEQATAKPQHAQSSPAFKAVEGGSGIWSSYLSVALMRKEEESNLWVARENGTHRSVTPWSLCPRDRLAATGAVRLVKITISALDRLDEGRKGPVKRTWGPVEYHPKSRRAAEAPATVGSVTQSQAPSRSYRGDSTF